MIDVTQIPGLIINKPETDINIKEVESQLNMLLPPCL